MFVDHRILMLTDGRFPSGGHAHSSGLEAAVADGAVRDLDDLEDFLLGWLSCGLEAEARLASLAADRAGAPGTGALLRLDEEAEAAQPSPALRRTGRSLGKSLIKNASRVWPKDRRLVEYGQSVRSNHAPGQHPVAFGVAVSACVESQDARLSAALAYVFSSVTGAAWSAVRLLPVDPVEVAGLIRRLQPQLEAASSTASGENALRGSFAPAHEIRAEDHARWEVRLFAS